MSTIANAEDNVFLACWWALVSLRYGLAGRHWRTLGTSPLPTKNPAATYSPGPFQAKYHRRGGA
jgi:hypothetical protein